MHKLCSFTINAGLQIMGSQMKGSTVPVLKYTDITENISCFQYFHITTNCPYQLNDKVNNYTHIMSYFYIHNQDAIAHM